ncbi:MAG: hypothetical protein HY676_03810 [Chloroflexi bacterium]|nr:hypothetical protein [Chloroflexota bacterium]
MGKRDYRHHEAKKSKKGISKAPTTVLTPQPTVQVIKKGKKQEAEEGDGGTP